MSSDTSIKSFTIVGRVAEHLEAALRNEMESSVDSDVETSDNVSVQVS